jgi:hypothetical protein
MNDTVSKGILEAIENKLLVKERPHPFKDRCALRCSRDLILGKGVLQGFAYAHGMETDLISLILIVEKKNEAVVFGKGLIDKHGASTIKIREVQFLSTTAKSRIMCRK